MLKKIIIENYRCYEKHEIEFRQLTIVVGKNNAGKSTLVEALRLIAMACSKFKSSAYKDAPKWLELPKIAKGISIKTTPFDFNIQNVSYAYREYHSKIIAKFTNNITVTVYAKYIEAEETEPDFYCTLQDQLGVYIQNKGSAVILNLLNINILPQISAIQKEEKSLASEDYIRQNLATNLSSLHFRNQLSILSENLPAFRNLIETSWPELQIQELEYGRFKNKKQDQLFSLMIREGGFVTEIGSMGHGLQMWLQIMWFLSRINDDGIVILDEPDVYMHPDLQRKLMRILKNRFKQILVSTHSIEIISEVEPEAILIIDKSKEKSLFASEIPMVQGILNSIGSIHNLQLTKLWASKKILLVEGDDISILKRIQDVMYPNTEEPFDTIPNFDLQGWGGWNYAVGSTRLLKETVDKQIRVYCLFDSDYHTQQEIIKRQGDAKKFNVELHIWSKKELENYLIIPSLILRVLRKETAKEISDIKEIQDKIKYLICSFEENTLYSLAGEIQKYNKEKRLELSSAILEAKKIYPKLDDKICGKELISKLSEWSQKQYGVSLSPIKLAQNIFKIEIIPELASIIYKIETNQSFS